MLMAFRRWNLAGSSLPDAWVAGLNAPFNRTLAAVGGLVGDQVVQFLLPGGPLGSAVVGHGVDEQEGFDRLGVVQGQGEGDGSAPGGAQDVGPLDADVAQQGAEVLDLVGDGIAVGGSLRASRGAAVVEDQLVVFRKGFGVAFGKRGGTFAATQAAVNHHDGRALPVDLVVHTVAVDGLFGHLSTS